MCDSTAYQHIHLLYVYVFHVPCCSASLLILFCADLQPLGRYIVDGDIAGRNKLPIILQPTAFAFVPGCTGSGSRRMSPACSRLGRHQQGIECRWNDAVPP